MTVPHHHPDIRPGKVSPILTRGSALMLVLVGAGAIAMDIALVAGFIAGDLSLALALAAHVGVALGVLAVLTFWIGRFDLSGLMALWVGFLGPLGALVATLAILVAFLSRRSRLTDEDWYQRLSGEAREDNSLVTALKDHRAYQTDKVGLHSFRQIMDHGSVAQKQTILGLIAQSYEPALAGLLMEALRSREVAVRASAAAVLARLRDKQAAELKEATDRAASGDHNDILDAANRFATAAASGLMSPADSDKAQLAALSLRSKLTHLGVVPLALHKLDDRLRRVAGERQEGPARPSAHPMDRTIADGLRTRAEPLS